MPAAQYRLAIDLSGSLVRVLEGTMGGPMRCGTAELPNGDGAGGRINDPVAVGQTIKLLLARTEIARNRALLAVSDAVATFRTLYFPGSATDTEVSAEVARQLHLDPERVVTRWIEVSSTADRRVIYAAGWDRDAVRSVTDAVRLAGVEPVVAELKSAALARTVVEPSCVIVDLSSRPVELLLVDRHLPQLWHTCELPAAAGDESVHALEAPLRSVLRFYRRTRDSGFGPTSPILISGEHTFSPYAMHHLADLLELPVQPLAQPVRVPPNVRHSTYLTCLGLIMRRDS